MAEPHVVAALKDKRAELSGGIADLEKRIGQHRADLLHVDAVLRLFVPEFEPATIPPRAVRRPNSWFRPGELARLVLEVLRTALVALTVREITAQIIAYFHRFRPVVFIETDHPCSRKPASRFHDFGHPFSSRTALVKGELSV